MSICVVDGGPCQCQPSEGCPCPGVAALHAKDSIRTREHNLLVAENRSQAAEIAALRAEVAGLRAELLKSLADNAPLREQVRVLEDALNAIDKECFSHVDGRDLFAQMHPRNMLDIRRRVDARETWFEGDWLTNLWTAIKAARAARKGEA